MICPRCRKELPEAARFCLHCGAAVGREKTVAEPVAPAKSGAGAPLQAGPRRWIGFGALSAVLLLLLAAIFLFRPGLMGPRVLESENPAAHGAIGVTQAPAPLPAGEGVLSANTPPPVSPQPQSAPADVVEYLAKLRSIEERRMALGSDFGPALEMLKGAQGMRGLADEGARSEQSGKISEGYDEYYQKWDQLRSDFNALQVPASCQPLHESYREALHRYTAATTRIWSAFKGGDTSALMSMQSTLQSEINRYLDSADGTLEQLCRTYNIRKPFDIHRDSGMDSSILGF
ncbi:MAG: zinc ribbon domain-containing protein [Armatimonadetes bacterium]|nr:zinc ribbon domain-containing protein [Armatimonadota bacterium]